MIVPTVALQVRVRRDAGKDRLGNAARAYAEPVAVPGCLWAPGTPADISSGRPEGAEVAATAHFPQGWAGYLRGALVSLDGKEWLRVVGEPHEYPAIACRGKWRCYVLLERTDG